MKRIFLAAIVLLPLLVFSCKKASGPADAPSIQPNNNLDSTVNVLAFINGNKWTTDSAFGYSIAYSGNDSGVSNLMITATNQSNPAKLSTITLNITNYKGPGDYPVKPPINTAVFYEGNTRNFALKGDIVITSDTAYALKGTFNFIADSITLTGGTFNVALP